MRHVLLFLATAGLTTFCLGRILPPPAVRSVEMKLEAFAERKDEFDVLLVGTSQTNHGVEPSLFDACTKAAGVETRSFNFGVPGAGLAELHAHLRRVAELEPKRLRWILVEAERVVRVGSEGGSFLTQKLIGMTDPKTAVLLWPYFGEVEPRAKRLFHARWRTAIAVVYHVAGVGRGVPWIESAIGMGPTDEERLDCIGPLADGYTNLEDSGREGITNRPDRYRQNKRLLERRARQVTERGARVDPAVPSALAFHARIEELGRSMGAQVVFFTIRRGVNDSDAKALERAGAIGELIDFDDPQRYPELYDIDYTFDGGHFNRAGAAAFTRYLAEAFAALVKSKVQ